MHELEFIGPNDKPALLALSTPEWLDAAKNVLTEIGYKVHAASNHDDFMVRFGRIQYQVVLIEELFACNAPEDNLDRKSTRLNSSHVRISYAVFCLKKKKSTISCTLFVVYSHMLIVAACVGSVVLP